VRRVVTTVALLAMLAAGCGGSHGHGVVAGQFRLTGAPAADVARGGLNFAKGSDGAHGNGNGHTVQVGADGSYSVTLSAGTYSVVGALSGRPGGPAPERCKATINVVVRSNATTRADYACEAEPATSSMP